MVGRGGICAPLGAGLLCCSLLLLGCGGEAGRVRIDLCPSPDATPDELALLRRVSAWNVEVWGIEEGDVVSRRIFGDSGSVPSLVLEEAITPEQQVRILVEGTGSDGSEDRLLALATSGTLVLTGGEELCLCTSPPETYAERCAWWSCSFDIERGVCEDPF